MMRSMLILISVMMFSLVSLDVGFAASNIPVEPPSIKSGEKPTLLAKKRKKRRKKRRKKKKKSDASSSAASGEGESVHAAHEGKDQPYAYEVGLLSDFAIINSQTGDAKQGSGEYTLNLRALYIIGGTFEAGGQLDYSESTTKADESESVNRTYVLTLLGAYNFGNIDQDEMVFFVNFGLGFGSNTTTSTVGEESTDSSSGITRLTFGVGLHYFVDSNVALTTQFAYDQDTFAADGDGDPTVTSTIHIAKIGFSLFI